MTKRVPSALAFPVIVLGTYASGMVIVAIASFFVASVFVGVALTAISAVMIAATLGVSSGRRGWWFASLGLMPITAAAQIADAYFFGVRPPIVWGILAPGIALVCLLLPSARAYFASTESPGGTRGSGDSQSTETAR